MEALNYQDACSSANENPDENDENDENCMICLEKIQENTHCHLNCKHKFHIHCILNSFKSYAVRECPYCRTVFTEPEYDGNGTFLKGFHKKNSLQTFLTNNMNDDSDIEWDNLTSENTLWIKKGINGMQKGTFVRITPSKQFVYLKLDNGKLIRSVKHNLSLFKKSNDD